MARLFHAFRNQALSLLLAIGVLQEASGIILADVSTLAGSQFGFADGTGTLAKFYDPNSARQSPDGTFVLVVSQEGFCVSIHPPHAPPPSTR